MVFGYTDVKHILYRISEEIRSSVEVAKVLSFRDALITLLGKLEIQLMVHNGHIEYPWIGKHLLKKHEVMNRFFSEIYLEFTDKYNSDFVVSKQNKEYCGCIWICWWQGVEHAPIIVKRCIESIKRNAGSHRVIVITDKNYREFISFPDWIEEKKRRGILSKTHFSDLLRLELLSQYGGVWLDSTFYCTGTLEKCFSYPFWSIKRPNYRHTSVACGSFANYSFGCSSDYRKVFTIIKDYAFQYWKTYDYMVDYLFLDYLIIQAQKQNECVREAFKSIKSNNPHCDELLNVLDKPYNEYIWNDLKEKTSLFKLSWKTSFSLERNGNTTFYGKLINGELY